MWYFITLLAAWPVYIKSWAWWKQRTLMSPPMTTHRAFTMGSEAGKQRTMRARRPGTSATGSGRRPRWVDSTSSTRRRYEMMTEHATYCTVYEWVIGERVLNNAKPCSCGFRTQQADLGAKLKATQRPLRPLGMSDADFLRSLGIKPEDDGL